MAVVILLLTLFLPVDRASSCLEAEPGECANSTNPHAENTTVVSSTEANCTFDDNDGDAFCVYQQGCRDSNMSHWTVSNGTAYASCSDCEGCQYSALESPWLNFTSTSCVMVTLTHMADLKVFLQEKDGQICYDKGIAGGRRPPVNQMIILRATARGSGNITLDSIYVIPERCQVVVNSSKSCTMTTVSDTSTEPSTFTAKWFSSTGENLTAALRIEQSASNAGINIVVIVVPAVVAAAVIIAVVAAIIWRRRTQKRTYDKDTGPKRVKSNENDGRTDQHGDCSDPDTGQKIRNPHTTADHLYAVIAGDSPGYVTPVTTKDKLGKRGLNATAASSSNGPQIEAEDEADYVRVNPLYSHASVNGEDCLYIREKNEPATNTYAVVNKKRAKNKPVNKSMSLTDIDYNTLNTTTAQSKPHASHNIYNRIGEVTSLGQVLATGSAESPNRHAAAGDKYSKVHTGKRQVVIDSDYSHLNERSVDRSPL